VVIRLRILCRRKFGLHCRIFIILPKRQFATRSMRFRVVLSGSCSFRSAAFDNRHSTMKQPSSVVIDTRSLKRGVYEFEFSPSAESIGLDPDLFRDIEVNATLQIASRGMVVSLDVSSVATLECDRTLVEFDETISGSFEAPVIDASEIPDAIIGDEGETRESGRSRRSKSEHREALSSEDEARDDVSAGDSIDGVPILDGVIVLDHAVRDTVLLAIPMRKISPEARTMEIESAFGKDDSEIDPRWEALKNLSDKPGSK